jgi:hypothetical protein
MSGSYETAAVTAAIHDNLFDLYPNRIVNDGEGTVVGVLVRDFISGDRLREVNEQITSLGVRAGQYESRQTAYTRHAGRLAVGLRSGMYFPEFEPVADIIAQCGLNNPDVAAERMSVSDSGHLTPNAHFHINDPDDGYLSDTSENWLGIVMHLTTMGEREVTLGIMRDPNAYQAARQHIQATEARTDYDELELASELEEIYSRACASFGEVVVEAGDLLIFQGASYSANRLAVAHRFTTPPGVKQASAILTPWANPNRQMVLDGRHAILDIIGTRDMSATHGTARHDSPATTIDQPLK